MWITKSEVGYYTIYYCPQCKRQRYWHTINKNVYKCARCELKMNYDFRESRLCFKNY